MPLQRLYSVALLKPLLISIRSPVSLCYLERCISRRSSRLQNQEGRGRDKLEGKVRIEEQPLASKAVLQNNLARNVVRMFQ